MEMLGIETLSHGWISISSLIVHKMFSGWLGVHCKIMMSYKQKQETRNKHKKRKEKEREIERC
jgi:hypothetical protein